MDELIKRLKEGDLSAINKACEILDGLSQDAIDGGWTARGMSAYAKKLEGQIEELKEQREVIHDRSSQRFDAMQEELAALIEDNDSLRKSLTAECEARCALEDEVKALRNDLAAARQEIATAWDRHRQACDLGNQARHELMEYKNAALSAASDGGKENGCG